MLNQKAIFNGRNRQVELYRISDTRWPEPIKSRVCLCLHGFCAHTAAMTRARAHRVLFTMFVIPTLVGHAAIYRAGYLLLSSSPG